MEKKPSFFFKIANCQHNGRIKDIAWLHVSIFNAFMEMKITLHLMTNTKCEGKGTLCFATVLKNDNSSCFDVPAVSTESPILN